MLINNQLRKMTRLLDSALRFQIFHTFYFYSLNVFIFYLFVILIDRNITRSFFMLQVSHHISNIVYTMMQILCIPQMGK